MSIGRRWAAETEAEPERKGVGMGGYEAQRRQHMDHAMGIAPALIERIDWPAERLWEYRSTRLRNLVRVAVERSSWHRKRLAGVDPGAITEASLAELPVMTKADLMENFDEITTDDQVTLEAVEAYLETVVDRPYLLDGYTAVASGGSTGARGVFLYDWEGWSTVWVGLFRYLLRLAGTDPAYAERPMVVATVAAAHFTHASAGLARTFSSERFTTLPFPLTLPTEQIVAGLNQTQPDILAAYASAFPVLAAEARAGRLRIAPRRLLSFAEPLLPEIRSAAEEAWGVRVGNSWAASEGGPLGVACDLDNMHLAEDLLIVEPVDADGTPVAPGKCSAKIYLTNLYNEALPLIRFEITDQATILPDLCPCGSAHRLVADVQGRLDDLFHYAGRPVHPHLFRSALGKHPGIVEYQVCQTPTGAQIAIRCHGPVEIEPLRAEIAAALAGCGLADPEVTVSAVPYLARNQTGKLKRFVALDRATPPK
jgi:phenylacetate-coenzyme A ligase PaaK-like adenylate-forming protein